MNQNADYVKTLLTSTVVNVVKQGVVASGTAARSSAGSLDKVAKYASELQALESNAEREEDAAFYREQKRKLNPAIEAATDRVLDAANVTDQEIEAKATTMSLMAGVLAGALLDNCPFFKPTDNGGEEKEEASAEDILRAALDEQGAPPHEVDTSDDEVDEEVDAVPDAVPATAESGGGGVSPASPSTEETEAGSTAGSVDGDVSPAPSSTEESPSEETEAVAEESEETAVDAGADDTAEHASGDESVTA